MVLGPPFSGRGLEGFGKGLGSAANAVGGIANAAMNDVKNLTSGIVDGGYGFNANKPPSSTGLGTRQRAIPPNRDAVSTRQAVRWLVPEQPMVEMYLNPEQIQYQYKKLISQQRTKGGYVLQYWGEDLTTLQVTGTTGTSGIEGINVLLDVYRNEQLMFDPFALFLEAERDKAEQESFDDLLFGTDGPLGLGTGLVGQLAGLGGDLIEESRQSNIINSRNKPTLASLAFVVEMYWSGEVYRGFFENFSVTERANNIGLFDYSFTFKVTQKRGYRNNFFPWHKHPSYGQSKSGIGGPPHSFGALNPGPHTAGKPPVDQPSLYGPVVDGFNNWLGGSNAEKNNNDRSLLDLFWV